MIYMTEKVLRAFKFTTMGESTLVFAERGNEAIGKFFKGIPNLRRWIEERKMGAAVIVEVKNKSGSTVKRTLPTVPILVNLGALSMDEGIQYLLRYNRIPQDMCRGYLIKEMERTQWVKDYR